MSFSDALEAKEDFSDRKKRVSFADMCWTNSRSFTDTLGGKGDFHRHVGRKTRVSPIGRKNRKFTETENLSMFFSGICRCKKIEKWKASHIDPCLSLETVVLYENKSL